MDVVAGVEVLDHLSHLTVRYPRTSTARFKNSRDTQASLYTIHIASTANGNDIHGQFVGRFISYPYNLRVMQRTHTVYEAVNST